MINKSLLKEEIAKLDDKNLLEHVNNKIQKIEINKNKCSQDKTKR